MVKIISLNIQEDFHIDKISKFLTTEKADVVCLQEVFKSDVRHFEKLLGMQSFFAPRCFKVPNLSAEFGKQPWGNVILTNLPVVSSEVHYYYGDIDNIPDYPESYDQQEIEPMAYPVLVQRVDEKGVEYTIATTHMPVTYHGEDAQYQMDCAKALLAFLSKFNELILTGDMNAIRGGATFSFIASVYKDNIPESYKTSLDAKFHRMPASEIHNKMVDGLFTTSGYKLTNVKLIDGVSDHMAIVGEIKQE